MLVPPIHCHDIHEAHLKQREAEARMYQVQVTWGGPKGSKLIAGLGFVFAGVLTAIAQAITGLPWLAGNDDVGQPEVV
jgi:hypothetical protein